MIGQHVVVAAQTGFSGSVTVGDYAVIGGQVGIGEKAKIESKAIVGGKAGILTSQTVVAGEPVWGIPARPLRGYLKRLALIQKLPELNALLREIRQRVEELESAGKTATT
jgi:UDP-3-O-[3-hydroxymyristoyl] glucosamine N-acyltransferase